MELEQKRGDVAEVLSEDLSVITAEINAYQRVAGEAIFEIGRRLKHVKENDLAHGQFGKWLESIGMTPRHAQQFMQIADEFGENAKSVSYLGFTKLLQISQLPSDIDRQEFIKQSHAIPSTGEVKTVDEMTVRELREVKKALKEAQQEKELAERRAKHVHDKKLAEKRGGWTSWLREIGMSTSQADRFVKIFKEYDSGKLPHVGISDFGSFMKSQRFPNPNARSRQTVYITAVRTHFSPNMSQFGLRASPTIVEAVKNSREYEGGKIFASY